MPQRERRPRTGPPRLRFRIPPDAARLLRARERIRDYLRQYCSDDDLIDDVVVCVDEACTNAILHGGVSDNIDVGLEFVDGDLRAIVKDRGRGFDVAKFDPSTKPDLSLDHGRGLFILATLTDTLDLRDDHGLEVRMSIAASPRCDDRRVDTALGSPGEAGPAARDAERRHAVLEEIDEAFYALDWEYRFTYLNNVALGMAAGLGVAGLADIAGHTPFELFPAFSDSPNERLFREAMEFGKPSVAETLSPVSGDWHEVRVYPTSTGISVYMRVINERKRVEIEREQLLEELERRGERLAFLADVIERADVPFGAGAPDGRLILFNQAFADLTGYSRTELEEPGLTWATDLTPPEWREAEAAFLVTAVEERRSVRYQKEYRRKDGTRVPIELYVQPVFGDDGHLAYFRSFVTDISERKRLEAERERLIAAEARAARTADTLSTINEILLATVTVDDVVVRLVGEVSEVAGADKSLVVQVDGDRLTITHVRNVRRGLVGKPKDAEFFPAFALAARRRRPVLIADCATDPRANHDFVGPYGLRAFQLLPLVVDGRVTHVLALAYDTPRKFDDSDRHSAGRMATAMSAALSNAHAYETQREAKRQARRDLRFTHILLEAATVVSRWADPELMLDRLATVLLGAIDHSRVTIGLWDDERKTHTTMASKGAHPMPRSTLRLGQMSSAGRKMLKTKQHVLIDYARSRDPGVRALIAERRLRFALAAPVVARGRVVATITIDAPGERQPFTDREVALVQAVAGQVGVAIDNARLSQETARLLDTETRARRLETVRGERTLLLKKVADAGLAVLDQRGKARRQVDIIMEGLGTKSAFVLVPSEDRLRLVPLALGGVSQDYVDRHFGPIDITGPGASAVVFRTNRPAYVRDVASDRSLSQEGAAFTLSLGQRAGASLPLVARGTTIGTLALAWAEPHEFDEEETAFLDSIAAEVALGMENAQLLGEVSATAAHLSDVMDSMTDGFVAVDRAWRYTVLNRRAVEMLGRPEAELLGRSMEELFPDMDGWPHYRRVMAERTPDTFEVWSRPLQTSLEIHAYPTADGISILFSDVSARREAEIALRESEARFGVLFETMEEGFSLDELIFDEDGRPVDLRYVAVNPAFERQTGLKAEDIVGHTTLELFPDAETEWFERYGKVALDGTPDHFEARFGPLDRWFEVSAYRTEPGYVAVVFFDISERKQAEKTLKQRTRLLEGVNTVLDAALAPGSDEELAKACLAVVERLTSSAFGFIGELDAQGTLRDLAISDPGWSACTMTDQTGHVRSLDPFAIHGLYGRVVDSGRGYYTNEPANHPDSIGVPTGHPPLTSFLGVPLAVGRRVDGMIAVANKPGGYDDDDLRMLEGLARAVEQALEQRRADRRLTQATQRLDSHMVNSPLAVIEFDSEFRITRWSDEAKRMFGWQPDEVLGKTIDEIHWVYEQDVPAVDEESNRLTTGTGRSFNLNRNYRKDGSVIWCEWYDSAIYDADGNVVSVLSQVLDVTGRKEAEEARARLLQEIDAERGRLREIIEDIPVGVALVGPDGNVLEINAANGRIWGDDRPRSRSFEEFLALEGFDRGSRDKLRPEDWPPARALLTGERVERVLDIRRLDGSMTSVRMTAVPVMAEDGAVARVVVITEDVAEEIEHERLNSALGEIGTTISATLEFDEILARLLDASATALQVDTASLTLRRDDGWEIRDFFGRFPRRRASVLSDQRLELAVLAATGRELVVVDDVASDERVDPARMASLGIRSLMVVPLLVQGATVGALIFHRRKEARPFSPAQVVFATRLMEVVTLALENARLYEREHLIADTLQQAVLSPPDQVKGLEVAWLYRPAASVAEVGGDFYDVFEVSPGLVGIVVGDVSGKGLEAARVTTLARDGIRAYAYAGRDPGRVLDQVNALLHRSLEVGMFATAFFGMLDVATGRLDYAVAGHPPAVVRKGRTLRCRSLPSGRAGVLGAFMPTSFERRRTTLDAGDVLVLYTDGVTEARRSRELFGERRLLRALRGLHDVDLAALPEALLERVLAFSGGSLRDDTVIVALRRKGED